MGQGRDFVNHRKHVCSQYTFIKSMWFLCYLLYVTQDADSCAHVCLGDMLSGTGEGV